MKGKKLYYLTALGVIFLLGGSIEYASGGDGHQFIYFGIGTLVATTLYYSIMVNIPQIAAFIVGLIVLHTGVLLIVKGELDHPLVFGAVTFTCGILVLLNSGFSEFMKNRKKN